MITLISGDLFKIEAQALVNPVNTAGIMGKGLALEFKKRFPKNFETYKKYCDTNQFKTGNLLTTFENDQYIVNFPTKEHWKNPSKIEYIQEGLKVLKEEILFYNIKSINVPSLGTGLGGLNWELVKKEIFIYLENIDCDIKVFEPL